MYYLKYCMVVYKDKAFKLLVDKKIQSHPVKKQTTSVWVFDPLLFTKWPRHKPNMRCL